MLQAGRFTLRRRKLESDAAPLRLRLLQAELFYFATKKIGVGRGVVAATTTAGGPFYFATKKIGVGRGVVAATTAVGETIFYCRNDESAAILEFRG